MNSVCLIPQAPTEQQPIPHFNVWLNVEQRLLGTLFRDGDFWVYRVDGAPGLDIKFQTKLAAVEFILRGTGT